MKLDKVKIYLEKVRKKNKSAKPFVEHVLVTRMSELGGLTIEEYAVDQTRKGRDGIERALRHLEQIYKVKR